MAKEATLLCLVLVAVFCLQGLNGEHRKPSVQVYSRFPVEKGKDNVLQCYVEKFHPPKINITLLKNNRPMESQKTDLSFDNTWAFHQLVYANITVDGDTQYACKVDHVTLREPQIIRFDPEF